jgi:hypothetical protein
VKIKTAVLIDDALDWAAAAALGWTDVQITAYEDGTPEECFFRPSKIVDGVEVCGSGLRWKPSTNWAQGGPISEQEGIAVRKQAKSGIWYAIAMKDLGDGQRASWNELTYIGGQRYGILSYEVHPRRQRFEGPTELVAKLRCLVASRLGEEVDVPDELLAHLDREVDHASHDDESGAGEAAPRN